MENKKKINTLIFDNYNIDFEPDSLNYYYFKIYIDLLLYSSMNKIKLEKNNNEIEIVDE